MTSSFVQKLRDEGWNEGWDEGRDEGRLEGQASMLLRTLERRFKTVPAAISERVRHADEQQLYAWHDRVFDAESLDEVFEKQSIVDSR